MVRGGAASILLLGSLWAAAVPAAEITLEVDRNPVALNESFTAVFAARGEISGEPDFSPLEQDFEIVRTGTQSTLQFMNGNVERKQTWELTLVPKRTGSLEIPPVDFGGARSDPLTLEVLPAPPGDQQEIFIEVEASPQPAYVQAQILFTVRLYLGARGISNATLSEPGVGGADAVIEKLGDGTTYEQFRGGKRYTVVERRYAIFPQRSGSLSVDPISFSGYVGRGFQGNRYRRVSSPGMELEVTAVPADVSGPWLPARSLALIEEWPEEPPVFRAGEPVTRTLTLVAQGLTAAQLPPFEMALPDDFKVYPDQPQLDDRMDEEGITGVRRERVALLPTRPGRYLLPAVSVSWWNTLDDRLETRRLPAREIEVLTASAQAPAVPAQVTQGAAAPATPATAGPTVSPLWQWGAGLLAAGWLLTGLAWWRSIRRGRSQPEPQSAAGFDARQARSRLRTACAANDPVAARAALLEWASARWPGRPLRGLAELGEQCPPALRAQLGGLNRLLYGPRPTEWNGRPLWEAFQREAPARTACAETRRPALAPLYR